MAKLNYSMLKSKLMDGPTGVLGRFAMPWISMHLCLSCPNVDRIYKIPNHELFSHHQFIGRIN